MAGRFGIAGKFDMLGRFGMLDRFGILERFGMAGRFGMLGRFSMAGKFGMLGRFGIAGRAGRRFGRMPGRDFVGRLIMPGNAGRDLGIPGRAGKPGGQSREETLSTTNILFLSTLNSSFISAHFFTACFASIRFL